MDCLSLQKVYLVMLNMCVGMEYSHLFWLLLLYLGITATGSSYQPGYCQVFSYNINHRPTGQGEKHFFVCCNNLDQKACHGTTYQKPSRTESFCAGQVLQNGGSHWTQVEKGAFPDNGRFYCGGCCGQRLAADACNNHVRSAQWPECTNWVQCFQRKCRSIVDAVVNNKPLKCSFPPHPYMKFRPVPNNDSDSLANNTDAVNTATSKKPSYPCTSKWCKSLDLNTRCTTTCCEKHCCLPDGGHPYGGNHIMLWGFTTIQILGITIGTLALLTAIVTVVLLATKRCIPGCQNFKMPSQDTQVLVIDAPEEVDSDAEST